MPRYTFFFPAYNDAHSLPFVVCRAYAVGKKLGKPFEILVVNDGSIDKTQEVIDQLKQCIPQLRSIRHSKNKGYGGALRSGFAHAKGLWIFYTDGDGQYDPYEFLLLAKHLRDDIAVVNGYKIRRSDAWIRIVLGNIYNTLLHIIYPLPIRDIDCDFRLIRRSAVQDIRLTATSGSICVELILQLFRHGCRFVEIPVHHYPRLYDKSQFFRLDRLMKTLWEQLGFYMTYGRGKKKI